MKIKSFDTLQPYLPTWEAMREFTINRTENTEDEIWLMQHEPVFTQGQAGKPEHILQTTDIPIVQTDRGGQVTYHGPGQLMVYTLLDLRRLKLGVRDLVCRLEQLVIQTLADYDITAQGDRNAPGVYVDGAKIAAIGLRVKKGCSYHGLAFNVDMDLTPFSYINPCGFDNLNITECRQLNENITIEAIKRRLTAHFSRIFT